MTTAVSYPIAKLLKDTGFDKFTEKLWDFNGSDCVGIPNKNSENLGFSAPTIAEVVMWLYEEHGIWIFVSKTSNSNKWYQTYQSENNREIGMENYNSPTEAYEAAIEYVLTNLL